ncbi:unnamed protein product, partial [Rotaria sp. Silwood2]
MFPRITEYGESVVCIGENVQCIVMPSVGSCQYPSSNWRWAH